MIVLIVTGSIIAILMIMTIIAAAKVSGQVSENERNSKDER